MRIAFSELPERTCPGMNGGTGELSAKMYADAQRRVVLCRIHAGGSIGLHAHPTGDDVNYVLSGCGLAVCDGVEEPLSAGVCHICPQGASHSLKNTGSEALVLLTVVTER